MTRMRRFRRPSLLWRLVCLSVPSRRRWSPLGVRRIAALGLFTPAYLLVQLVHWMGFLLDEIFFPRYRQVQITEPLFVVGLPRSGTSRLQRTLALDDQFTTMRLWELLLAPSVTERRAWLTLAGLDRVLGRPIGRMIGHAERAGRAWMSDVHPVSLTEPEEDYLLLLPAFACFLLVLAFPEHPDVWRLSRLDAWEDEERDSLLLFYQSCLQRHLYVVGSDKRILSKNPSFTPFVRSLSQGFPDARFLCCIRDPMEVVPSQLSSVEDGMALFGADVTQPVVRERFVSMVEHYGHHMVDVSQTLPADRWGFVPLEELRRDLAGTIEQAYARFGWTVGAPLRARLEEESRRARAYASTHSYSLEKLGVSSVELGERFAVFNDRFGFGSDRKDATAPARRSGSADDRPRP